MEFDINIDLSRVVRGLIIYDSMYVVGFILMMIVTVYKCNIYNITRVRAAVYTVFSGAYGLLGLLVLGDIYNAIATIKVSNPQVRVDMLGGVVFELLLIPITVCVENYFRKRKIKPNWNIDAKRQKIKTVSVRDTLDLITPGLIILSACGKIGCHFAGCCYGIESSWGIHFPDGSILFPVQLFEAATMCIILVINYYIKQTKFFRRGMSTPLVAAMYLFARFFWEFLRYYIPEMRHFFLGLSLWQIFCVIMFIITVAWVIVLYKTQPSEPKPKNYLFAKKAKEN